MLQLLLLASAVAGAEPNPMSTNDTVVDAGDEVQLVLRGTFPFASVAGVEGVVAGPVFVGGGIFGAAGASSAQNDVGNLESFTDSRGVAVGASLWSGARLWSLGPVDLGPHVTATAAGVIGGGLDDNITITNNYEYRGWSATLALGAFAEAPISRGWSARLVVDAVSGHIDQFAELGDVGQSAATSMALGFFQPSLQIAIAF